MGTYVIKQGNTIKLGVTSNIKTRLSNYNTHSAEETILLKYDINLDGRELEKLFRSKYKNLRIRTTEWFEYTKELEEDMLSYLFEDNELWLANKGVKLTSNIDAEVIVAFKKFNRICSVYLDEDNILTLIVNLLFKDKYSLYKFTCNKIIYFESEFGDEGFIVELLSGEFFTIHCMNVNINKCINIGEITRDMNSKFNYESKLKSLVVLEKDKEEYFNDITLTLNTLIHLLGNKMLSVFEDLYSKNLMPYKDTEDLGDYIENFLNLYLTFIKIKQYDRKN